MPKLNAVRTAVPPYRVEQPRIREYARELFVPHVPRIDRLLPVFDHAGICTRYFSRPLEWFGQEHEVGETNRIFIETATSLGAEAGRRVLDRCGLKPEEVDYIVYINTTGLATPSIDARLINVLGLRRDIRRTPVWGLGCAGGAAGLSHAYHYALGHPGERVLVVCFVESDPLDVWDECFAGLPAALESGGRGRTLFVAPFVPVVPGVDPDLAEL